MFMITTQCFEDYGHRVKPKGGRTILVETDYRPDAEKVANLIGDEFEHIMAIDEMDMGNYLEEMMYHDEMNELNGIYAPTRDIDPVVRRGRNGDFYLKRGYYVNRDEDRPEFKHLAGKFVGWVDNLNTGKCVMKIEGEKRTRL